MRDHEGSDALGPEERDPREVDPDLRGRGGDRSEERLFELLDRAEVDVSLDTHGLGVAVPGVLDREAWVGDHRDDPIPAPRWRRA